AHGASFMRSPDSADTYYTCTRYEVAYLPPNLNVIQVGVRTDHPWLMIHIGIMTVEAIQYAQDAKIGLQYPSQF
ncbi:unnamed protein product, partial [Rotaria magnacalcarata]